MTHSEHSPSGERTFRFRDQELNIVYCTVCGEILSDKEAVNNLVKKQQSVWYVLEFRLKSEKLPRMELIETGETPDELRKRIDDAFGEDLGFLHVFLANTPSKKKVEKQEGKQMQLEVI